MSCRRFVVAALFAGAALLAGPALAQAQTGTIAGRVTDRDSGSPIPSARVEARTPAGRTVATVLSNAAGEFRLTQLPPGVYTLQASTLQHGTATSAAVVVAAGGVAQVSIEMTYRILQTDPLVITASRGAERASESPATTFVVPDGAIAERPTVTPADHLRSTPGVDIITHGVQATNVVARGFNNLFSTALHMLTDYRMASIPSLRVNLMHFIPASNEDVERIEVVLGPGSALYGPNTANGVVHFLTRSPLDEQGNVVTLGGGLRAAQDSIPASENDLLDRDVFTASFRTAHRLGERFGFKLSGQLVEGEEWRHYDETEQAARRIARSIDPNTRIGLRDFTIRRWSLEARADWRVDDRTTAVFSAGHTNAARGIELTGIGAGQTNGWKYSYVQARAHRDRLFGQVYMNTSDAGDTFILRNGLQIVDHSRVIVGQIQHGTYVGERFDLVYGGDVIRTLPDTRGTIHGRNEDADQVTEAGAYAQLETRLTPRLDLITAGRVDHHSLLDAELIFSPRAALVFRPAVGHNLRLTFNQAFSTPVPFNTFLDIDAGLAPGLAGEFLGYRVRAMGTEPNGFTFQRPDGTLVGMRSPFARALGADPSDLLEVNAGNLWQLAITAAQQLGQLDGETAGLLRSLSPTDAQVGIHLRDPATGIITPLAAAKNLNVSRVQESRTSTLEVGYTGLVRENVVLTADVWYERRHSFVSPLTAQTPLLQLDSAGIHQLVAAALVADGIPPDEADARAGAVAEGLSGLPAAVVSSLEVNASAADILASFRNFGRVSLMGADVHVQALLGQHWAAAVGGSYVSRDHFFTDGFLVGLNAPRYKATASLQYRDGPWQLFGELRVRYTSEFPVSSAPTSATRCIEGLVPDDLLTAEDCIPAATLVDLTAGWDIPRLPGASMQLSITNLFDRPYRSFVDVPAIGRFAMVRLRYAF